VGLLAWKVAQSVLAVVELTVQPSERG